MGVVCEFHRKRMYESIWLFMWLLGRQTGQLKNGIGIVNYGKPITFGVIYADTGFPVRTLQKWMYRLVKQKYVRQDFEPNNEFKVWILNAKKYPVSKQLSTGYPQGVYPSQGRPYTHHRVDPLPIPGLRGVSKSGRGGPRKRQKAFGFIQPSPDGHEIAFPKESTKESTTVLRASPAILIGAKNMDTKPEEKNQEKAVAPSLDAAARSMSIPRAEKSARELDAERRHQLDELAAKDKIPRIKVTQSTRTLEEQKAELKKRGFLP